MATAQLVDSYGRIATDLRVSVTDRCNLRCTYCMPAQGLDWLPSPELLSFEEIARLVGIAVNLGVRSVRLTGGEPLLRRGLPDLVGRLAALTPRPRLSLTTNGIGLVRLAEPLARAGLDRINVSLDTIEPAAFTALTLRDRLPEVISGLTAAADAKLAPIKINAVVMRGVNDTQVAELLSWAITQGYELRFIEQMPLDAQHAWQRTDMITQAEILTALRSKFRLTPDPAERGSAPAQRWLVDGGPATVGVIASVSQPFCGDCNRMRLTADGQLRSCLFARTEGDLRTPLRAGASDAELADAMRRVMAEKKAGHGIDDPSFLQPQRPMSAIGG
ncbi:MAG: GTP 3',8-cyclase MoaA [Angustibacter sp.]